MKLKELKSNFISGESEETSNIFKNQINETCSWQIFLSSYLESGISIILSYYIT